MPGGNEMKAKLLGVALFVSATALWSSPFVMCTTDSTAMDVVCPGGGFDDMTFSDFGSSDKSASVNWDKTTGWIDQGTSTYYLDLYTSDGFKSDWWYDVNSNTAGPISQINAPRFSDYGDPTAVPLLPPVL